LGTRRYRHGTLSSRGTLRFAAYVTLAPGPCPTDRSSLLSRTPAASPGGNGARFKHLPERNALAGHDARLGCRSGPLAEIRIAEEEIRRRHLTICDRVDALGHSRSWNAVTPQISIDIRAAHADFGRELGDRFVHRYKIGIESHALKITVLETKVKTRRCGCRLGDERHVSKRSVRRYLPGKQKTTRGTACRQTAFGRCAKLQG